MRWEKLMGVGGDEVWACKDGPITYAHVRRDTDGKWLAEVGGSVMRGRFDTPGQAQQEASRPIAATARRVMTVYWTLTIGSAVLLSLSIALRAAFGWDWLDPIQWVLGGFLALCLMFLLT